MSFANVTWRSGWTASSAAAAVVTVIVIAKATVKAQLVRAATTAGATRRRAPVAFALFIFIGSMSGEACQAVKIRS